MGPELHGVGPSLADVITFCLAAVALIVACLALGERTAERGKDHALSAMAELWKQLRGEVKALRREGDDLHQRVGNLEARGVRADPAAEFPRGAGSYDVVPKIAGYDDPPPSGRTKLNPVPPPGPGGVGPGSTLVSPGSEGPR